MTTTKWIKTMSENVLDTPLTNGVDFVTPNPVVLSGDGTIFYVVANSKLIRYKYINNAWTSENFLAYSSNIAGSKFLPNFDYAYPVATSQDGNVLLFAKNGDPRSTKNKKLLITSYSNGEIVQVGSEITFTKQSNFNLDASSSYFIQRVFMSDDGVRFVVFTHGGMNTFVCSNGSWNLLPSSSDITSQHFAYDSYGSPDGGTTAVGGYMSKNGMYLVLLENLNPGYYSYDICVFKFDTQTNNWSLFKKIDTNKPWAQLFVSDTGDVIACESTYALYRYELNVTTNNYQLIVQTSYILSHPWDCTRTFMSADCNTYICRYRYIGSGTIPVQRFRRLKYSNGNWQLIDFSESVLPFYSSDQDNGGRLGMIYGLSSDGTTMLTTQDYFATSFNVYYNLPLPTLHLGDFISIKEKDVNFNNANTFVKAPTVGLNVSNKQYVDTKDAEVHALILASADSNTTSTTEYYDLLGQRQTVQSTLAIQVENLYQYFFNQSRVNAVLFESDINILNVGGCCLWLDGADSNSVITSGSYVSGWNDKSGLGYNFTQTNSANRPTYVTNAVNNHSIISFTRSNQNFLGGPKGFNLGTNSYSLFVVCDFTSNAYAGLFNISLYGPRNGRILMVGNGYNYGIGFVHSGIGELNISASDSGYRIIEMVINRAQGKDSYYHNGTKIGEQNYSPDNNYSYTDTNYFNMIVGGYNNWGGEINPPHNDYFFDGKIAEIVAFLNPYDMTDLKRQQIEGYLAKKWGIQSKLPSNHPYKTNSLIRL